MDNNIRLAQVLSNLKEEEKRLVYDYAAFLIWEKQEAQREKRESKEKPPHLKRIK